MPREPVRERRALRLGVASAVLAFLVLTGVQAAAIRPYLPPDELYHVGYAAAVLDGRLPTLTSPLPADRVPLPPDDGRPRRVHVANHPSLFYAISAVPLWLGERFGTPRAAVLAARLLSAVLAGASAAAALTRAPGLALVMLAGVAASTGVLLHGQAAPTRRALAAAGALVAGVAGGSAIGFYLRNRSLYGSLTGAGYNQELFRFEPQDHVLDLLVSPAYALRLYDGLWVWTRFNLPRVPALPLLVAVPRAIGLRALAGLAVAGAGRLRDHRWADRDLPAVAAWALMLAWAVAVFTMVAAYDGNGGHTHPRYLLPGLAVLAVVAAFGLDRLPGARRGQWIVGVALAQLVLTAAAWSGFRAALDGHRPGGPAALLGGVADLLEAGGARWPWVVVGVSGVLVATALTLLLVAVALVAPGPTEPVRRRRRAPAVELPDAP
jgi:hypothetical protein